MYTLPDAHGTRVKREAQVGGGVCVLCTRSEPEDHAVGADEVAQGGKATRTGGKASEGEEPRRPTDVDAAQGNSTEVCAV